MYSSRNLHRLTQTYPCSHHPDQEIEHCLTLPAPFPVRGTFSNITIVLSLIHRLVLSLISHEMHYSKILFCSIFISFHITFEIHPLLLHVTGLYFILCCMAFNSMTILQLIIYTVFFNFSYIEI